MIRDASGLQGHPWTDKVEVLVGDPTTNLSEHLRLLAEAKATNGLYQAVGNAGQSD